MKHLILICILLTGCCKDLPVLTRVSTKELAERCNCMVNFCQDGDTECVYE